MLPTATGGPRARGTRGRRAAAVLLLAGGCVMAAVGSASGQAAACRNVNLAPGPDAAVIGTVEVATVCLVNEYRTSLGLTPLNRDGQLDTAARNHSRDMATRKYFDHVNPDGVPPAQRASSAGYDWQTVGENIATGFPARSTTARVMVKGWLASEGHCTNILAPSFADIGAGVAHGSPEPGVSDGGLYTHVFGTRSTAALPSNPDRQDLCPVTSSTVDRYPAADAPEDGVTRVSIDRNRLDLQCRGRSTQRCRPRRRPLLTFTSVSSGRVTLTFEQARTTRSRRKRSRGAATRWIKRGTRVVALRAGTTRFRWDGRVQRSTRSKKRTYPPPGTYRIRFGKRTDLELRLRVGSTRSGSGRASRPRGRPAPG